LISKSQQATSMAKALKATSWQCLSLINLMLLTRL